MCMFLVFLKVFQGVGDPGFCEGVLGYFVFLFKGILECSGLVLKVF